MCGSPLYTPHEVAALLKVPETWVRDKITARAIPFTWIGKHARFTDAHVAAIVTMGECRPQSAASARPTRRPRRPTPGAPAPGSTAQAA
jgi:excisionase family DNA binding protein